MSNSRDWLKKHQIFAAGLLLGVASYSVAVCPPGASAAFVDVPANAFSAVVLAQLEPSPAIPNFNFELPPEAVVPTEELTGELAEVRSRLADIETLPLFLLEESGRLVSASTQISSTQLSTPTFAWIEDQLNERYGPNQRGQNESAITQWRAYATTDGLQYVDVVIDAGLWTQFTYFDRYGFVQQFGEAAIAKGYQLRVFHTDDVDNYIEALTLEENGRDPAIARPVYLRGSYFCGTVLPTFTDTSRSEPVRLDNTPACEVFVTG